MGEARGEMQATGGAATGMKTVALGISAAVIGIGYESAKLATDFQAQMASLATQAGVPQGQIKDLSNRVLDLAGQVGFSPTSLAEALYHVESSFASVGITGPKAMELLKTAAEGAAVGHANLVDVTNALDAAVASGIPGVQDFQQAMGVLNATVGAGDMNMQDLADAFSTGLLATVKGYGLSITDVGAALATFGDNNIRGANAATDLRMAVQALAVPAKSGEAILSKMGIASGQLAKDMQTGGLMKALEDLKAHMDKIGVSAQEQGQVLTDIFGKKAGVGAAVLYDQLDRLKSKYPELTKSANNFGTSWAETQRTFSQKMKEVEATLAAVGVRIGEKLLPILLRLADWFVKSIGWLGQHKAVLEAVGAIAGGALAVGIAAAATAVWGFTAALLANPIFMIVEGLVALGVGVYEAYQRFAWFRTIVQDVGRFLVGLWKDIVEFAKNWRQYWGDVTAAIKGAWDTVYGDVVGAWDNITSYISGVWGGLVDLWNSTGGQVVTAISDAWDEVAGAVSSEWDHITGDLSSIWGNLVELWNDTGGKVVSVIAENWSWISQGVKAAWDLIYGYFKAQFEATKGLFLAAWDAVKGITKTAWDLIKGVITTAWDLISGLVQGAIDFVSGVLKSGWDLVLGEVHIAWDLIKGAINTPLDFIKNLLQLFTDFFTGHWSKLWTDIKNLAAGLWNDIYTTISGVLGTIKTTVLKMAADIWNGFIGAIGDALGGVFKAMDSLWRTITGFFKDTATWLWQAGKDLIQGFVNGIGSMFDSVKSTLGDLTDKLTSWKGPPSKDAVLLHGSGRLIMQGLINGIVSQKSALRSELSSITDMIGMDGPGRQPITAAMANGVLSGGLATPAVGSLGFGGGPAAGGGATVGIDGSGLTVEVYMDGQKIQGAVRQQTLRYQNRNSRNNLSLIGVGS